MAAMMTVTNPGDKVIIFSPFYENYGADTILSGAEPIYVPLVPPDFHFDAGRARGRVPPAPQGDDPVQPLQPLRQGVHPRGAGDSSPTLAEKYDAYVITDEVYEHIVYAPHKHTYFATLPGMWERTLSCCVAVQDLLDHRLASRLHHRAAEHHRPREKGARFPDGRRGGAASGGRCHRTEVRAGLL